jgi:hypothetical protein
MASAKCASRSTSTSDCGDCGVACAKPSIGAARCEAGLTVSAGKVAG